MSKIIPARLADQPKDYERLGLSETILPWEDGLASQVRPHSIWWQKVLRLATCCPRGKCYCHHYD